MRLLRSLLSVTRSRGVQQTPPGTLRASYTTSFPEHISELMPVYLDPSKNFEWNHRMHSQTLHRSAEHGDIVRALMHVERV